MDERPVQYLSVAEAARELGVSDRPIRTAIKRGELEAFNFGERLTMIPQGAFEQWRESRRIGAKEES